jgi:hypothetical protein
MLSFFPIGKDYRLHRYMRLSIQDLATGKGERAAVRDGGGSIEHSFAESRAQS